MAKDRHQTMIPDELLCAFVDGTTSIEEDKQILSLLAEDKVLAQRYADMKEIAESIRHIENNEDAVPDVNIVQGRDRMLADECCCSAPLMPECCCIEPEMNMQMDIQMDMKKTKDDYDRSDRVTPYVVDQLKDNEIFVFGSNLEGIHAGGAARAAVRKFGAVMYQGVGLQGRSYAIPTMQGGTETIVPYVNDFIAFAKAHPELTFLVTRIGCGIAGFEPADIAPLFKKAMTVRNIFLPHDFWDELDGDF